MYSVQNNSVTDLDDFEAGVVASSVDSSVSGTGRVEVGNWLNAHGTTAFQVC